MKKFVILFTEKEGTTPLVRLLDKFEQITILRQDSRKAWQAWEPFDVHESGPISFHSYRYLLESIFAKGVSDLSEVNRVYCKTANYPLLPMKETEVLGFKMRFKPISNPLFIGKDAWSYKRFCNRMTRGLSQVLYAKPYKNMMLDIFLENNVTVFFAVRQDLMRWGLSKYRGEGKGKPRHLQFQLAKGEVLPQDIKRMNVDCKKLAKIIKDCESEHIDRKGLMEEMQCFGINAVPLKYEDFLSDKHAYLKAFSAHLKLSISDRQIANVIASGEYFQKVNSNHIPDIVANYEEVEAEFGNCFFPW